MITIRIHAVGRPKSSWVLEGIEEYNTRLRGLAALQIIWAKTNSQLEKQIAQEKVLFLMDEKGKRLDSASFAKLLSSTWEKSGSAVAFVVGGADGIPESIKKQGTLLSLSPLTFPHELARLILVEQIYRALQILEGTPYHRS